MREDHDPVSVDNAPPVRGVGMGVHRYGFAVGRWLGVAALLAVAAVGLAAGRGARADARNPAGIVPGSLRFEVLVGAFLVLAVVAPIIVGRLARRRSARPDDVQRGPVPIPMPLVLLLGAALLVMLAVVLLPVGRGGSGTGPDPRPDATPPGHVAEPAPVPAWLLLLGGVLVGGAVVLAAVLLRPRRERAPVWGESADPNPAALRDAAVAGRVALAAGDDPGGAVLACYRAMERSLAARAAAPAAADTPSEVLGRAVDAGLLPAGGAGARLVALFGAARYSQRPLDERATVAARHALDGVLAELASRPTPDPPTPDRSTPDRPMPGTR